MRGERAERIAQLERENADLREVAQATQRDLLRATERAAAQERRALDAEETASVMRERARTLWEALYKGKITKVDDILREVERIVHA